MPNLARAHWRLALACDVDAEYCASGGSHLTVDNPNVPEPVVPGDEIRDSPDQLDDASRADLHCALIESERDVQAGRLVDAAEVLRELRQR
jgi:hypothetical protein